MNKKFLLFLSILLTTSIVNAYEEVDCSSNNQFSKYNCSQCFDWGSINKSKGIWFLDDIWVNNSLNDALMYKEEQKMPVMYSLDEKNVVFTMQPSEEDFWEYTTDLESFYSETEGWYVLPSWKSVSWIRSKIWNEIILEKNNLPAWENIGMLVFSILTHNILSDGSITTEDVPHNECVLFTSWNWWNLQEDLKKETLEKEPEINDKDMTKVTTWPEHYLLLLILAMLIWFFLLNKELILEKIRK